MHIVFPVSIFQDVGDVGALLGGIAALYAAIRGIPILANRIVLVRRVEQAEANAAAAMANERIATDAAKAFRLASHGWQSAVEQIGLEVSALRQEITESRAEVQASRDELKKARELLAEAIIYITNIHTFMRLGGAPPEMSSHLREELAAILDNQTHSSFNLPEIPSKERKNS